MYCRFSLGPRHLRHGHGLFTLHERNYCRYAHICLQLVVPKNSCQLIITFFFVYINCKQFYVAVLSYVPFNSSVCPSSRHTPCCAMIPGLSLACCLLYSMLFNPVHVSALLWICVSLFFASLHAPHAFCRCVTIATGDVCTVGPEDLYCELCLYYISCTPAPYLIQPVVVLTNIRSNRVP